MGGTIIKSYISNWSGWEKGGNGKGYRKRYYDIFTSNVENTNGHLSRSIGFLFN